MTNERIVTFCYENAIVRVHIPELSEEERKRRMDLIKKAAAELLKGRIEE